MIFSVAILIYTAMLLRPIDQTDGQTTKPLGTKGTEIGLNFIRGFGSIDSSIFYTSSSSSLYKVARPEDLILSPAGLMKTLNILALSAVGPSADEIQELLTGATMSLETCKIFHDFQNTILDKSSPTTITWSTKIFLKSTLVVKPNFARSMKGCFGIEIETLNFGEKDGQIARDLMNRWVAEKTNNKITEVISAPIPSPLTRLLILDVLYFKSAWEIPFKEALTISNETFYAAQEKKIVRVAMMRNPSIRLKVNYIEEINAEYLELPFAGNKISMYIVLPLDNQGLPYLLQHLKSNHIKFMTDLMEKMEVDLRLPRLTLTSNLDAKIQLQKLGVKSIFDPQSANLSEISDSSDLYVSEFRQSAALELNEKGVEAIAVTKVEITVKSGPYTINVDHPFFYFLYDNEAHTILFAGTIWNPSKDAKVQDPLETNKILNEKVEEIIKALNEKLLSKNYTLMRAAIPAMVDGRMNVNLHNATIKDIIDPEFMPYIEAAVLGRLQDVLHKYQNILKKS